MYPLSNPTDGYGKIPPVGFVKFIPEEKEKQNFNIYPL
jgi:hypothetical protein